MTGVEVSGQLDGVLLDVRTLALVRIDGVRRSSGLEPRRNTTTFSWNTGNHTEPYLCSGGGLQVWLTSSNRPNWLQWQLAAADGSRWLVRSQSSWMAFGGVVW